MIIASIGIIGASFLVGSIPFSYIIAKSSRGIDLRKFGSGNVGATNVFRSAGKKYALLALLLDMLKGLLPTLLVKELFPYSNLYILCASAGILGHIFTPFLSFRGGKGVATSLGALIAINIKITAILLLVFAVIFASSRIVSLSSISSALALPPAFIIAQPNLTPFGFFLLLLILYTHRENIRRLLSGSERRII